MPNFQPRFIAYAKAHGRTPEAQLEHDMTNAKFICWVSQQRGIYAEKYPDKVSPLGRLLDQKHFDDFLSK